MGDELKAYVIVPKGKKAPKIIKHIDAIYIVRRQVEREPATTPTTEKGQP